MRKKMVALVAALAMLLSACALWRPADGGGALARPVGQLRHEGRWFTDATGRVVMPRGVNFVQKSAPYYPAAVGFGDDDAEFLAREGFNTVRLGVVFGALMPEPGVIAHAYIDGLAESVRSLSRHGIYVLLDFHQDGYGPATHGNGMPEWSTITDGYPNPPVGFPLYYTLNPALQRAFDNFWANTPGPDGVPLQTHYATGMRAIAARFGHNPYVLGYEPMNEPWPGTSWQSCLTGCPDLEQQLLAPFYERMSVAVRSVDRDGFLFVEPFVLFNFGSSDTSLSGFGAPQDGLSTHVYALDAAGDLATMQRSVAAAERSGSALLATEWGATNDPATLTRLANQFDSTLLPWVFWAYPENVIIDTEQPPTPTNLRSPVVDSLVRPYPVVTDGTPAALAFDPGTKTFSYEFSTARPDGHRSHGALVSTVFVPPHHYADGYTVTVTGARATSRACAPLLTLRNRAHAETVVVHVAPGGPCH